MSQSGSTGEIWILGATGRIGRAVAARLAGTDVSPVACRRTGHGGMSSPPDARIRLPKWPMCG
jgi:uncharacterized protein YbjT (DUF2867 family)